MIVMSDGTHLFNFVGDKKEWSEYMTIGILSSKFRQMPSTHSVVMVTLLPIPINNRNIPQKWLTEQQRRNREVLNAVLQQVLQPLTFKTTSKRQERVLQRFLCSWQLQALQTGFNSMACILP
jgi:hypothetical protein